MKPETYTALLKDLQRLQKTLVASQIAAVRRDAALSARLAQLHAEAEVGGRIDDFVATAARKSTVLFLLRTVFVRVLEDLGILELKRFRGDWGFAAFREVAPALDHRAYFAFVFRDLAIDFPALFAPSSDELPLPDQDGCLEVWELWHHPNRDGEHYVWNGDGFDSRFLGDLYQDLDKDIRKRYALLQTPRFVEEYILDHTLTPALVDFDPATLRARDKTFRVIDPTCGSGHFLIGAFHRLADYWRDRQGLAEWDACDRALESVWGCDINPHAVDIAAFRLLLEVVARTGRKDLSQLAALRLNLHTMDSLIPWERASAQAELFPGKDRLDTYATPHQRSENAEFLSRDFHVIVGNPPYITPKDRAKRLDYAAFWPQSCFMSYALSAPFLERFVRLAADNGYVGQITSNSFMKRQFGQKVIRQVLPRFDLTHVIDTSGAYIPGHGTPTVILIVRQRPPIAAAVYSILGKRGEPKRPTNPSAGMVWSAISRAPLQPDDSNPFITIAHVARERYAEHPWSLGGGLSAGIVANLEEAATSRLGDGPNTLGVTCVVGEDETLTGEPAELRRVGVPSKYLASLVEGDDIRDYSIVDARAVLLCMDSPSGAVLPLDRLRGGQARLWAAKQFLRRRKYRGIHDMEGAGKTWYELRRVSRDKFKTPLTISFAFVSTSNHFALHRNELADNTRLFARSAPVLKLGEDATEDDHLDVLGLLGSSTLGFWMKQTFHDKGNGGIGGGIAAEDWERFYEYDATKLESAPIVNTDAERRVSLSRALDDAAVQRSVHLPARVVASHSWDPESLPAQLIAARENYLSWTHRMVALQEELDWLTYRSYGLLESVTSVGPDSVEALSPGHRPFEIVFARVDEEADDDERSAWWSRHGHERAADIPSTYSESHRARLQERIEIIETNPQIAMLEAPAYKRRWQLCEWESETKKAAESWLVDKLEDLFAPGTDDALRGQLAEPRTYTLEQIVAVWSQDPRVAAVAGLWTGTGSSVDLTLVAEKLLRTNSLPDNPHRLYTDDGLRKLNEWKRVWALQDQEDAWVASVLDAKAKGEPPPRKRLLDPENRNSEVESIPLPTKFEKTDFKRAEYFATRGRLNVHRERFVIFSELSPPRFGWNGWRDRERALAQVDAFTLAETDPQAPLPIPTTETPQRCGVTLGLWESLTDVKRWGAPDEHSELQSLAQEACRQSRCPCPVLDAWKARVLRGEITSDEEPIPLSKGKGPKKGGGRISEPNGNESISLPERAWIARLLESGNEVDLSGIWALHQRRIEDAVKDASSAESGEQLRFAEVDNAMPTEARALDEARLAVIVDDLVASGDIAVRGRGKKKRYQLVPRATRA